VTVEQQPWDASVLVYCDAHTAHPLGLAIYDAEPLLRDDVYYLAQYRRRSDHGPEAVWVPEKIIAGAGGETVWMQSRQQWLDVNGEPIDLHGGDVHQKAAALERAEELAGVGPGGVVLNHLHVKLTHRGCGIKLRLSPARLGILLDAVAAQGITGLSLVSLNHMNTRA
jgi:hypothetical protein